MEFTLSLTADNLDDDDLQELTQELCRELNDEGIAAQLATRPAEPGERAGAEIELLGKIILAMVPVVTGLVEVLKIYAGRKSSLQFELKTKDGDTLTIKAEDLEEDDMTKLVKAINDFKK